MAQVGTVNRYAGTLDALAAIGRDESKIAMEKQAKVDFAAGVQASIQGRTLEQIDEEQPWYNKVFGPSATLRGAESQTAITAINQYFSTEAAFLDTEEGRAMDPNTYRKRQSESLRGMLTGNSRVDSMITADVTPKLGALSETHTKAHRAYVNEQNLLAVSNRVLSEAQNVQSLAASQGWSHDLTGEAKAILGQSLSSPPPGMEPSSWRKMLVESVMVNYKQGSEVMARAVEEMGVKFTPQEQLRLLEAKASYERAASQGFNLEATQALGVIAAGVDDGITPPEELKGLLAGYQAKYGNLTNEFSRSLFRKAYGKQEEQRAIAADASLVLQGRIGEIVNTQGNVDHKRAQPALQAAYQAIEARHDMQTPEGRRAADRDKKLLWSRGSVQDNALKSEMSYISGTGVVEGKVDPNYVKKFEKWMGYAEVDAANGGSKALDLITGDENQARAQAIFDMVRTGSVDSVESGILAVESMQRIGIDKKYLASKDFENKLDTEVKGLADQWDLFGLAGPQDMDDYLPVLSAYVRGGAKQLASLGIPVDAAVKTKAKQFARTHDNINGFPLDNQGTPLAERMGLKFGGSPQEAINFHMAGLDGQFTPDDFRVLAVAGDGNLIIALNDPDNPDYAEAYHTVSLQEIGNNWNVKAVLPPLEGEVANAARKAGESFQEEIRERRWRKRAMGFDTGLDDATLIREMEQQREDIRLSREVGVRYFEAVGDVFKLQPRQE